MSNQTQRELAENFYKQIDEHLESLKGVNVQKREALGNKMHYLTVAAAILPLVMTAISGGLFILTEQALTFITSLVDVVPPMFISRTKSQIDVYNKSSEIKNTLISLKGKIGRLVIIGQLKDDILKEIEKELEDLAKAISQLGPSG